MINSSELEGEVDHSFFDSDCDTSSEQSKNKADKGVKADKESPSVPGKSLQKHLEKKRDDLSPKTDDRDRRLNQAQNDINTKAGWKECSRSSSASSVSRTPRKIICDSSGSETDFQLHSGRHERNLLALRSDTADVDGKDVSSQSPNESEDEMEEISKTSKRRHKYPSKKRAGNQKTQTPSLSSSLSSADADLDSSCSSSSRRTSLESPTFPTANKVLSAGVTRTKVGSAVSQRPQTPPTDESDYTVTDVSPLVSPHTSPSQSLDCTPKVAEKGPKGDQQEECVPSCGQSNVHEEDDSDQDVDDCSLTLESQLRQKLLVHGPGARNRKNYSFTNDEVRRIDRENQRLLRELSRLSPGPRSGSAMTKRSHAGRSSPSVRPTHSALNRQREQQRIERENLSFLKRLQSVKPTPGLRRSDQLADYQRQAGYLGVLPHDICRSTSQNNRASSRTSSAGPRSVSSGAVFTASESSSTPVPRPKKGSAARPAWC